MVTRIWRSTVLPSLVVACSCGGAGLSGTGAESISSSNVLVSGKNDAGDTRMDVATPPAPAPICPPVAPPTCPEPQPVVVKPAPVEFPEIRMKGWACTLIRETAKPHETRSFCERTLPDCNMRRLSVRESGKLVATPCKRRAKAYCIRIKDPVAETVFNWCAESLALCQAHTEAAKTGLNFREILIGCTLRE